LLICTGRKLTAPSSRNFLASQSHTSISLSVVQICCKNLVTGRRGLTQFLLTMKEGAGTVLGEVNRGVHICGEACARKVGG